MRSHLVAARVLNAPGSVLGPVGFCHVTPDTVRGCNNNNNNTNTQEHIYSAIIYTAPAICESSLWVLWAKVGCDALMDRHTV